MPIPRRFDRRPPERDSTRVNEMIRVPEVRLIGEDGNQIGVVKRDDALRYAQERDLDLVEVAPESRPPVCRVLDYSKYKYEQKQKAKAARKHQKQITVREMKLRPKIAENDYSTKRGHVERFLRDGAKVKVTIMFRGREQAHPERGERLLLRLAEDVAELGTIEQRPNQDGRNMTMMLGPAKKAEQRKPEAAPEQPAEEPAAEQPAAEAEQPAAEAEQPAAEAEQPAAEAEQPAAEAQPAQSEAAEEPAEDSTEAARTAG